MQQGRVLSGWPLKRKFSPAQLHLFEALVGNYLRELGYAVSDAEKRTSRFTVSQLRLTYGAFYPLKQWAKVNTPLSRWMVDYSDILIDK